MRESKREGEREREREPTEESPHSAGPEAQFTNPY